MKFRQFEITDVEEINNFLEEVDDYLGSNGVYVFADRMVFMWNETAQDQLERNAIVEKMKEHIIQQETSIALQEVEVRHMREEIQHGTKKIGANTSALAESENVLNALKRKLEVTRKVMQQVKTAEFIFG